VRTRIDLSTQNPRSASDRQLGDFFAKLILDALRGGSASASAALRASATILEASARACSIRTAACRSAAVRSSAAPARAF